MTVCLEPQCNCKDKFPAFEQNDADTSNCSVNSSSADVAYNLRFKSYTQRLT